MGISKFKRLLARRQQFIERDSSQLPIKSPNISVYDGRKVGTGFVASHIRGKVTADGNCFISSRHHMLNSFVPNLVWLPVQVSKLTDREGSFAQKLLQAISYEIYKDISLPEELRCVWETLAPPEDRTKVKIDSKQLNFFSVSDNWLTKRIDSLISEIDIILSVSKTDYIKTGNVNPAATCQL